MTCCCNTDEHGGWQPCPRSTLNKSHQWYGFINRAQCSRERRHQRCGAPPWLLLLCISTPLDEDSFCRETFHCKTKLILSEREQGSRGSSELSRMSPVFCGSSTCLLFAWESCRVPHCCSHPHGLGLGCVFGWLLVSAQPTPHASHLVHRTSTRRTIDYWRRAKVCCTDLRHFIFAFWFLFISSFSCGWLGSLYSAAVVLNADDSVAFILGAVHAGCGCLTFRRENEWRLWFYGWEIIMLYLLTLIWVRDVDIHPILCVYSSSTKQVSKGAAVHVIDSFVF